MAEKNLYAHKHYTYVAEEKEADAVAWAFLNEKEFVKFPFKFEPLGEEEVRVNITHTGLCHSDSLTGRSLWGPANYPIAPGHEIIGIVAQVGTNVKSLKVGDRVGLGPFRTYCDDCKECRRGDTNLCRKVSMNEKGIYGEYWGGYATATQHPAKLAFKIPEALPSDRTAPLLCAGITVHAPLARYAKPGDKVAIIGIGGLGHLAVTYANKFGCHVTAFSATPGKEEFIKQLGAHEVANSSDPAVLTKYANEFDVILNTLPTVDPKLINLYIGMTSPGGTFVQLGAPPATEQITFGAFLIIPRNINYAGSLVGSKKETIAMLEFSARHNILPLCEFFGFEDFPKALDTMENGRPKFRCVVNVEDWSKKNGFYKQ